MEENTENTNNEIKTDAKVSNNSDGKFNLKKLKKFRTLIVTAIAILFAIYSAIVIRADYINAMEINEKFTSIVDYNVKVKYSLGFVSFIVIFLVIYINNLVIKGGLKKFFDEDKVPMPKLMNKTFATLFGLLGGLVIPSMIGLRRTVSQA